MELPIKLNSSWISTFKNLNANFENEYKRDYLPNQIYNFNAVIQHKSSLENVSNSKIHLVNDENNIKFGDCLQSWTLGNTDIVHDSNSNNSSNYHENSSTLKDEQSFKKISNDNLNIQEISCETIDQDLRNNDSRFEFKNKIEPEISISLENNLKVEKLQNSALKSNDSENECVQSEESFVKDTSNLLLQSGVKSLLNDSNETSSDFSKNNLLHNQYSMKDDTTLSNENCPTEINEINDQSRDQSQCINACFNPNESNENVEKIENSNLEYESEKLKKANVLNENEKFNKIYPNTNDFEYLKEYKNKNISYQNKNKYNEIQSIEMKIETPEFINHEPKLCIAKTIDFSTINESDQSLHDNNSNKFAKPLNNEFLNLEKDLENLKEEILETEIFQTISPSTFNQKYMPNNKDSFETKLDQMKDNFENYLSDDSYMNTNVLLNFHQNLIVNDVSQEIIVPINNIKTEKDDSITGENNKDLNRNDNRTENNVVNLNLENEKCNLLNLNTSLSNPIKINDVSENHFNLNEKKLHLNDILKQNENADKIELFDKCSIIGNSDAISFDQSLAPEIELKENMNPIDNFYENDLNGNKYDNEFEWKKSKSVIPDNLNFIKQEINKLEIENDSHFVSDFMPQEIDISSKENKIDDFLNIENINDQLLPIHNFTPVFDAFQNDENSNIKKYNHEFDGNLKSENLVNENINNSFTNPNELDNDINESFKIVPTNFKEINVDISSFVQNPDENKCSFFDDSSQNSSNNYENENAHKINFAYKQPIEIKATILDHSKSVNDNVEYELDNSGCNFELKFNQNISRKVSENNWKEKLSTPKNVYEKYRNENENVGMINQEPVEYKNKFNDSYEKIIKVKPEDNFFSTNKLLFQKHEMPYKENNTDFTISNDNQLHLTNNFLKCKNVDNNQMDDINSYVSPSFHISDTSPLKSDFDKYARNDHFQTSFNLNENNANNFEESDNRKSLNNKINAYKMSDKLNMVKPDRHYLEDNNDDDKTIKSNSTIFKLPIKLKSDMQLTSHKMRNYSDTCNILKHNLDSSYNYDSTNLMSKENFKNNYYPSSQNFLHNNQIKYSNDLSHLMNPYKNKRDIHNINESVLVNEQRKDKNTPVKNMNTLDSFSVTKNQPIVQGMFENNKKMIYENNEKNNITANGKTFCKKCMKFHLPSTSYDSWNYHNISKPYLGNKNLKSSISSNLPRKIISKENSFGKGKFVPNINTEPSILSKCYSKKNNMSSNDVMDLNSSVNSNCNFISNASQPLELRVYCRGRLIYEPLF